MTQTSAPSSIRKPRVQAPPVATVRKRIGVRKPRAVGRARTIQVLSAFTRFMIAFLIEELVWRIPIVAPILGGQQARKNPERLCHLMEELGGAFIKFGQLFSMRSDILPPEYCTALGSLFDDVPPFPTEQARAIIEQELGQPIEALYKTFEDKPLGAASFGQVHQVTIRGTPDHPEDDGRPAVVKICRPGSEETISVDGKLLMLLGYIVDALSVLGRIKLVPVFRDFVKWTHKEVNYLQEAKNADHLHELTHWNPRQRIPYIYWDKTTNRVLTMEFLEGMSVSEVIRRFEAGDTSLDDELEAMHCDRPTIARNIWQTFLLQAFVGKAFHGDPHPGNLIVLPNNVVGFIDFGLQGRVNEEARRELGLMLDAISAENIERLFVATLDVLDAPRGLLVTDTYDDFFDNADAWLDACDNPGAPMAEKTLQRFVQSAMQIARQVGLVLATQTMLFFKGVLTVDAVILRVSPDFDYKKESRRALRLIRMRELDKFYAPGNVIDSALLTQLLINNIPNFAAARIQDLEQGQKLIYRKLNLIPVVMGTICKIAAYALFLVGMTLIVHRLGYLERFRTLEGAKPFFWPLDFLKDFTVLTFLAAGVSAFVAQSMKSRTFSKVQRD